MFALKLFLVPGFIALITLASHRWGAKIGGWLAGFPVVAGPVLLLLALDHGATFAATAATMSLAAVVASISFSLAYAWSAQRYSWCVAAVFGLIAWFLAVTMLIAIANGVLRAFIVAAAALIVALVVTFTSPALGPTWSGALAIFPTLGGVLAVFSHISRGPHYAATLLRGMSMGLWSIGAFTLTLAVCFESGNASLATIWTSFTLALLAALVAQIVVRLFFMTDRK